MKKILVAISSFLPAFCVLSQQAPVVVTQPTNQTVMAGGSAAFSVVASGTGPLSYFWQFNGGSIPARAVISTVAGNGSGGFSGDGGSAVTAGLTAANACVDNNGNLYIADYQNQRVRRVGTNGVITTVAGTGAAGFSGDGGAATNARLNQPYDVVVDSAGNLFFTENANSRVRKVDTNGIISTFAGTGAGGYSGDNGPATLAKINAPNGLTLDYAGNLLIADQNNARIRRVDTNGIITTIAGNGFAGFAGDGGAATNARLNTPLGVCVDVAGNLFIADGNNNRIRKVDTNGIITTFAGSGATTYTGDGGAATNAGLNIPDAVTVDGGGNIYIADYYHYAVRAVGTNGVITTFAGNGKSGFSGDAGPPANASIGAPNGVRFDTAGNLYIPDTANRVRKVSQQSPYGPTLGLYNLDASQTGNYDVIVTGPFGSVTSSIASLAVLGPPVITGQPPDRTVALGANAAFSVTVSGAPPPAFQWYFGGAALAGETNSVLELTNPVLADAGGYYLVATNLYGAATSRVAALEFQIAPVITRQPADQNGFIGGSAALSFAVSGAGPLRIQWQFNGTNLPGNTITTVAGTGYFGFDVGDDGGPATDAPLGDPLSVAVDGFGNFFVAERGANGIRRVGTNGIIDQVAGRGINGFNGDGIAAASSLLNGPTGIHVDSAGNRFIGDTGNQRIRKVGSDGIIVTVAGNGTKGYGGDGFSATNANLSLGPPTGVVEDNAGNLYFADTLNQRVRRVGTDGIITTVAGIGTNSFFGDGGPAINAALSGPTGLALDSYGNLYIADTHNNRVRRVGVDGIIETFAGNGTAGYTGDGAAAITLGLSSPSGLAVDANDNLFIADAGDNRIRMVGVDGNMTTVAGDGSAGYTGDGGAATNAALFGPSGVAVDGLGNLYVVDEGNDCVRKITAKSTTLELDHLGTNNAGTYDVIISNPYGSITSSVVSLDVVFPPVITRWPPTRAAILAGGATNFSVGAGGTGPLSYQWYLGGTAVAGQTNSVLSFTNAGLSESGHYYVVVSSPYSSIMGGFITVAVGEPPGISIQPTNQTVSAGSNVILNAGIIGTGPFTYHWQCNGTNLDHLITTVAGGGPNVAGYGDGGPATNGYLSSPVGLLVDEQGNLLIADLANHRIRRVGRDGIITTLAGGNTNGFSGDGTAATNALLNSPDVIAMDPAGNIFIADSANQRVRRIDTNGIITTIAGSGAYGHWGDGGPATNAELTTLRGIAVDDRGDIFVADYNNMRVREISTNGIITTAAGNGAANRGGDGGPATNAGLPYPSGLTIDDTGNLFVCEDVIRRIDVNGVITTFAGSDVGYFAGDGGPATNAVLSGPTGTAVDSLGNVYIADTYNNRIRVVNTDGVISTIAGSSEYSAGGTLALATVLNNPCGLALDAAGNLFIADTGYGIVREMIAQGPVLALTNANFENSGNYSLVVTSPFGSVTSAAASLTVLSPPVISEQPNDQTETLGNGTELTVSATGTPPLGYQWFFEGVALAGQNGTSLDLASLAANESGGYYAEVSNLFGVTTSRVAQVVVGIPPVIAIPPTNLDLMLGAGCALAVTVSGTGPFTYQWRFHGTNIADAISTFAGNGTAGFSGDGGSATNASLSSPVGLAVDAAGNLFISDYGNSSVRRVDTNGIITTVAGNQISQFSGDGGPATNASLFQPRGLTFDRAGNLFIADYQNSRVRRVDTNGVITTVAGVGFNNNFGDGGLAFWAGVGYPIAVATDAAGDLFVVDNSHLQIRKIGPDGVISTVAGSGATGFSEDGTPATNAAMGSLTGLAVDHAGNLFLVDQSNQMIRKVGANGIITTVAGRAAPGNFGDGGAATNADLNQPYDVALDPAGDLVFSDLGNNRVRKVGANGIIFTIAGDSNAGFQGDQGPANLAELNVPAGLAADSAGNIYIADFANNRVRKLTAQGPTLAVDNFSLGNVGNYDVVVSSRFGSVTSSIATLTAILPPAIVAQQYEFVTVVAGGGTNLDISVTGTPPLAFQWYFGTRALPNQTNSTLQLVNAAPTDTGDYYLVVTNAIGSVTSAVITVSVGFAPTAEILPMGAFAVPGGNATLSAAVTGSGPLYYQWLFNGAGIAGEITTVAGTGAAAFTGDGGPATLATLSSPVGVTFDRRGNLFISDNGNNVVRKISTNGIITTVAGNGVARYAGDGGPATNASLSQPRGLVTDEAGDLFIADFANFRVRMVDTNGIITTVAGNGGNGYDGDGGPATNAALSLPIALARDSAGSLLIADYFDCHIRKVGTDGLISTVAGNGTTGYSGDGGPATNAALNLPSGLTVDPEGNIFIVDQYNQRVRKLGLNGVITTVAGNGVAGFSGDSGYATNASVSQPYDVMLDPFGNLLISDSANQRIRGLAPDGTITTVAGSGAVGFSGDGGLATAADMNTPSGMAMDAVGDVFIADYANNRVRKLTARGPTLTLGNITSTNFGNYSVVVTSPYGSVTSSVVTLVAALPPLRAAVGNGGLTVRLNGAPARQALVLESARSLAPPVNWQPVFTNAADASGNWAFTNANVQASPALYYRVTYHVTTQ